MFLKKIFLSVFALGVILANQAWAVKATVINKCKKDVLLDIYIQGPVEPCSEKGKGAQEISFSQNSKTTLDLPQGKKQFCFYSFRQKRGNNWTSGRPIEKSLIKCETPKGKETCTCTSESGNTHRDLY